MILEFLNLGGTELGIILAIIAIPLLLILYCIVDIIKSEFKTGLMRFVFLALVLFAPLLGSIIYLFIRKDFLKPKHPGKIPVV